MVIKRSLSYTESEDEIDLRPTAALYNAQQNTPTKRAKKEPDAKRAYNKWKQDEDAIFLDIIAKVLKEHVWQEVKRDGRLLKGPSNVVAHTKSVMNKLRK